MSLADHIHPDAPDTDAVAGVNAKDRHVAAITLAARADILVSNDRRLRRQVTQLDIAARAMTGDEFTVGLHAAQPAEVTAAIETMIAKRVRRPVTSDELLARLATLLPRFAAAVKANGSGGRYSVTAPDAQGSPCRPR